MPYSVSDLYVAKSVYRRFPRGAEWGHFEFGSTIVLLVPRERFRLELRPVGTPLRLGEAIGRRLG